ncbi:MAG TPA: transglycosylase domain-containing protein [Anaerolineae bacterium]
MNRLDQIERWRHARRVRRNPHIGLWTLRIGAGCLVLNLAVVGILLFGAAASVAGVYAYFAQDLPDPTAIQTQQSTYETVKIYDRTGQHLLYEAIDPRPFRGDRTYLSLNEIPVLVRDATIALEDRDFYTNMGVNFKGIGRALLNDLRGQQVQGGSSITQQLVKQILIDPNERYQQSYARKIKEVIMALEITRKYPGKEGKDQILEWYINHNFYGNAAYGVAAAANVYFNKSVNDLTLDEVAVLQAVPQYPGLNPIQSPADAYRRQRKVLAAMEDAGYLTHEQVDSATRYFNTRLLNDLVDRGLLTQEDLPLVATGDRAATARALNAMVKANLLSQSEADSAKKLNHTLWQYVREFAEERFQIPPDAPHFALTVLQQLEKKYNTEEHPYYIWQHGLRVYTTLDWDLQVYAECVARSHVAAMEMKTAKPCQASLQAPPVIPELQAQNQQFDHKVSNASVVAIRPPTGEVLAMVGSLDYFDKNIDGQVNVAMSSRQPGSSFKPYTYLTAFASGNFSPATMAMDVRTVFPDPPNAPYAPENYDRTYHGPQMLRWALQRSYNIPAVWLMNQVGVGNVIKTARKLGVSSLNKELSFYGLALTLGGGEVQLLDHTYAFSVFANGGVMAGQPVPESDQRPGYRKLDPVFILEVRDKDDNTVERYEKPSTERVFDPAPVYILNNVLSDTAPRPVAFGSYAKYLQLADRPVAAKTGTTNNFVDDWTLGYTPQLAIGVWTGNSDNTPMSESSGSLGAAPIWHAVMQKAMEGKPVQGWTEPPGIQHVQVCVPSGLLPTPDCPQTTTELFLAGHAPAQKDNMFQAFDINKNNGKLATVCTPPDAVVHKGYQIFPLSAADYVRDKKIEQPPKDEDGPCAAAPVVGGDIAISGPVMGDSVRGTVAITGTARSDNFRAYKLEVAPMANPDQWQPIGPEHPEQVTNGHLETWDTKGFDGLYHLRLTVMKHDGGVQTNDIQVIVDNAPPKVKIVHPQNDAKGAPAVYTMEDDEMVSITAEAEDAWAMGKVEFYLDGKKLGESTVAPYSIRWTITMASAAPTALETHTVMAKAYDRAGNEADSPPVTFQVKHKPKPTPSPVGLAPDERPDPGA